MIYTPVGRGYKDLFYIENESSRTGIFAYKGQKRGFSKMSMPDMTQKRTSAAICNFENKFIFVTGGIGLNSVIRLEISNDKDYN